MGIPAFESEIESLARKIYNNYIQKQINRGLSGESELVPWEDLSSSQQAANLRQAATIPAKLSVVSCRMATKGEPAQDMEQEVAGFSEWEIEHMARYEHELWVKEREGDGWVYASVKRAEAKETPYLVDYDELTEDIKELDRDAVRNIVPLLQSIGLKVLRFKPHACDKGDCREDKDERSV